MMITNDQYLEQEMNRRALLQKVSEHSDIYALVSTQSALLLVNLNTKEVTPLEYNRPDYYGISWFPNGKELVLSHSVMQAEEFNDPASYAMSEVGVLSYGNRYTPNFLSSPHQVLCASDNRVICINTGRNAISIIDFEKLNHFQEMRLSPARWDLLPDGSTGEHLNSVFEKNGHVYVVAHGRGEGSFLATLTYPNLEIEAIKLLKNSVRIHNIWITDDDQRISCGSGRGELIEIGDNGTSVLWKAGTSVFTRGLAASRQFVLVGETQMNTQRELRRRSMSAFWMLDRETWQPIDYFCLGNYGAVHDVRLINIPDEAHHGHPFQGLEFLLKKNVQHTVAVEKVRRSVLVEKYHDALIDTYLDDEIALSSQHQELVLTGVTPLNHWGVWSNLETQQNQTTEATQKVILLRGWSNIEDWGVWSDGESATFIISSKELPEVFKIELAYIGFVTPIYPEQRYEIFTESGKLLHKCNFEYINAPIEASPKKVVLNLNKTDHAYDEGKYLAITIKMLNPMSPEKLEIPGDTRLLGSALQNMRIYA
jgi:hypothetical protein